MHLNNAIVLKDYGAPATRYQEFFILDRAALPNWAFYLLIAGLAKVYHPLVVEKIIASIYIVGFAYSFRYFLRSLGNNSLYLASAGLLFLFNRCFLTGSYNYCLSLILFWMVLGYSARHHQDFTIWNAVVLALLLELARFVQLLGCVLAAGSAAWLIIAAPPLRARKTLCAIAATLPVACMALAPQIKGGYLGIASAVDLISCWKTVDWQKAWSHIVRLNEHLFQPYEGKILPLGLLIILLYQTLVAVEFIAPRPSRNINDHPRPPRLLIIGLGLVVGLLYVALPDIPGGALGFTSVRLALLPPLLWLGCLRIPDVLSIRRALGVVLSVLVGLNIILIMRYFGVANQELKEFTGGIARTGRNHALFVVQSQPPDRLVNCLKHAADYYCLTTANVNLDNFQATRNDFPIRLRSGIERGSGSLAGYAKSDLVDVILTWNGPPELIGGVSPRYHEIYREGRLRIFGKKELSVPSTSALEADWSAIGSCR